MVARLSEWVGGWVERGAKRFYTQLLDWNMKETYQVSYLSYIWLHAVYSRFEIIVSWGYYKRYDKITCTVSKPLQTTLVWDCSGVNWLIGSCARSVFTAFFPLSGCAGLMRQQEWEEKPAIEMKMVKFRAEYLKWENKNKPLARYSPTEPLKSQSECFRLLDYIQHPVLE